MALALLGGIGFQLWIPQLLRDFIDTALGGAETTVLFQLGLVFLGVSLLHQTLSMTATWLSAKVGWTATNQMREDLARHCLHLDMRFHHRHTPGELIERIDGDVTNLSNFFSQFVVHIFGNVILTIGILYFLFRESMATGASLLLFTILSMALLFQLRRIAVPATVKQREASANLFGFMEEKISALDDIRANGGGPFLMRRFYEINHHFFHTTRKAWMTRAVLWLVIVSLLYIGNIIALAFSNQLFQAGHISAGTVVLFFYYIEMLRNPIERITRQLEDYQNAGAGMQRANELLNESSSLHAPASGPELSGPLTVSFDHVHFAYVEKDPVLQDLHFELPAGQTLGLLGRTGSGKTTLARLLFRLYDPQQGSIRLNGHALPELRFESVRNSIGMVTQEVRIFQGSVRDNIRFFDESIPDEAVLDVLQQLDLTDWLQKLPEGLDTRLGAGFNALSAGEAQLLACSRIFLKNPGLLILDEPTSRMDPATERLVRHALDRLMEGRSALVIAHRLSTIERLDSILILEEGRMIEFGPQAALRANPDSHLQHLLRTGLEGDAS